MRADKELNVYAVSVLLLLVAPPKSVYEVVAYLRTRFSAEVAAAILPLLGNDSFREGGQWFRGVQDEQRIGRVPVWVLPTEIEGGCSGLCAS